MANPYHFRSWWNAIQSQPLSNYTARALLYQRALQHLPGSYKLWYNFLKESKKHIKAQNYSELTHPDHLAIISEQFEKALIYLHNMPAIWLMYAQFKAKHQLKITQTRQIYDRALLALPVTQHHKVWDKYIQWVNSVDLEGFNLVGKRIFDRYVEFKPEFIEDELEYLLKLDMLEDALNLYLKMLDDEGFVSARGKTKYQLWMELCEFIAKNPHRCSDSLKEKPEDVIRHGIRKYTDEVAKLWIFLAEYYTRLGLFGRTRDVFEEAIASITTARDFGIIFNAYMKFEEQMIESEEGDDDEVDEEEDDEDGGIASQIDMLIDLAYKDIPERQAESQEINEGFKLNSEDKINSKFFKLESLIQRRPLLMSNTVLRQNPHNVYEWLNRIALCQDNPYLAIKTYTEAITTVDPQSAFGKFSKIWISFAHFYEQQQFPDLEDANLIFYKASQISFKSLDELANIYCQWTEMHLRHNNYESALAVMQQACNLGGRKSKNRNENSLHHNLKAWTLYVDLLENLSTVVNTKAAYDRMLELKIATPQTVLNYASYLQKHLYFEESYRVYERALNLFEWPHVYEIWANYLSSMIERHADSKVERIRDLFEQVLKTVPQKQAKLLYYMYADFEENFGLINHAMKIYDRACKDLENKEDKFELYNLYLSKCSEFYGVSRTRQLYERVFEVLQGMDLIQMGLRFAKLERKLGEVDRARAIYQHLSQFCNPRVKENEDLFWTTWEKFEVYHGNEDTYSDFMKAKRTVELKYSISNPIANMIEAKGTQIMNENDTAEDEIKT